MNEKKEIILTVEKSEEQAILLQRIKTTLVMFDIEYLRKLSKLMYDQASRADSASVLIPNYRPEKSELLRCQAKSTEKLCDFLDALKDVDEARIKVNKIEEFQKQMSNIFGM